MGIVAYQHPTARFSLPLPEDWERAEDPQRGVALIAIEPERRGFRANLVVTVEELPEGADLDRWQALAEEQLPHALEGYLLLDCERSGRHGRAVVRRLAHHARTDLGSITMEQWALVEGRKGITLTASAGTLEYDGLAAMFSGIADELRTGGEPDREQR